MSHDPSDPIANRARQARSSLIHQVGDPDVAGARRNLATRAQRQRSEQVRARLAAATVVLVALVGGAGLMSLTTNRVGDGHDGEIKEMSTEDQRALLENLPGSAIDGKASWRLPVGATPQSGLRDGDTVTIYGRGFNPDDSLGVVHCAAEADTLNAGVDACDLGIDSGFSTVQYVTADAQGNVVAEVTVRRFIETPGFGRVDCAAAAERCLLGMGAISDYDRSGGAYINFEGAPEFEVPALSVAGADTGLSPGRPTPISVTGWVAQRMVRLQQCFTGGDGVEQCQTVFDGAADQGGRVDVELVLNSSILVDGAEIRCGTNCELRATGIGVPEGTTAPLPEPVRLLFATPEPGAETVPPTTLAPSTTTTTFPATGPTTTSTVESAPTTTTGTATGSTTGAGSTAGIGSDTGR